MKNWKKVTFDEVCEKVGSSYQPSENGSLKYIGLEHIESGCSSIKLHGCESEVKSSKTRFQSGDILYGKLRPYLDKAAIPKFDGICSTDILVFKAKTVSLNDFLVFLIHSEEFIRHAKATTSGVQHPRTSWESLKEFKFLLPPIDEQKKIAYILNTVQTAIEQQDKLIKTTTELKKALMQKLFTEGTKGEKQKQTEIGLVPESWIIQPFETTGEVVYGIQAAVASNLKPVGHKILTNKNITIDGNIDLDKINYFVLKTKRHFDTVLKKGDLLFNWRSGSKEHVGKTAIFNLDEGEYVHSSFILRIRVNESHNASFLFYYLNYLRESGYYQKVQTYSINAKFNKTAINSMPIALPTKKIQNEISSILLQIDAKMINQNSKLELLQHLFKTLLHELMTGQRRVNEIDFADLEKEVAANG